MKEYNSLSNNKKYKLLFVCLGNICRSSAAEEVFRTLVREAGLQAEWEADSAGLLDYHEGELPDPRMRRHAAQRGYTLTHRSRPIRPADFERSSLILAMDPSVERTLRQMAPSDAARVKVQPIWRYLQRASATEVHDPYYGGPESFELALDLIEDACAGLLQALR